MRSKAVFEVNINSFKKNLKLIQKQCPHSQLLLMVKANAYGHGAIDITKYAIECGIRSFGLATMQEALELRKTYHDKLINFYAFSETELNNLDLWKQKYLHQNIIPVIENLEELDQILNDTELDHLKLALKVNIGMNRFGFSANEIQTIQERLIKHNRNIFHLIGHLPCSPDLSKIKITMSQVDFFSKIKKELTDSGVRVEHCSVANSGAIERGLGVDFDFVRPGLLAYGCLATKDNPMGWRGQMISNLKASPLKTFSIVKGEVFGYGSTPSPASGVVAVIPLGYADGLTQNYSGVEFKWGNQTGVLIGYVNMDICYVLFKEAGDIDDWIEIWGDSSLSFAQIAKKTKTITYQLLCQISLRVPRLYKMR